MDDRDSKIARLLRAAARGQDETSSAVPFGFDTRVVALWRAGQPSGNGNGIARLIRRVALVAVVVIVVSGAAVFREFEQSRDLGEPLTNEFAIADSAIQNEFGR